PAESNLRKAVVISNPLGEDTSIMRTTAIPSIMEVIARNYNARLTSAALFENATEYIPNEDATKLPTENEKLIVAAFGDGHDYLYIKGIVEKLLSFVGIDEYEIVRNTVGGMWHPGRTADVMAGDVKLATIGEIHPAVLNNYKIKPRVVVADISVDNLFITQTGTKTFTGLPKFPAITRDLALVAKEDVPAAELVKCIKKGAGKILESLTLFDIYRGENIGAENKSLAYSLTLRSNEKNLTDEDADNAVKKALKLLEEIGVSIRS
ncbi:MAG: phenylalanine--tRNA ligase subunit beta, partial [Oscillospiraceae bacterium]